MMRKVAERVWVPESGALRVLVVEPGIALGERRGGT